MRFILFVSGGDREAPLIKKLPHGRPSAVGVERSVCERSSFEIHVVDRLNRNLSSPIYGSAPSPCR